MIPVPERVVRLADSLVKMAQRGELGDRADDLRAHLAKHPGRAAELVLVLACRAGDVPPPQEGINEWTPVHVLREAHALYARGVRLAWVCEGERMYQRLKKRRQRRGDAA